jgi:nucleoside-diphosphate-sugar epimerase
LGDASSGYGRCVTTGPILVTGAAGLIGGRLVGRLVAEGPAVIAMDLRAAEAPSGVRWVTVDLMDGPALTALMREARVGAVVHAGAISGPMVAAGDPHKVMSVNVGGTLNIAEASLRTGVERLVALSSAGVYGAQATFDPVGEDAPLNATDVYGASKIAAEAVVRAYRHDHGLPAIVLRPSSVYGPGRMTACFIRDMIDHARRGEPLALAPEGACRRQFVHVDDVVAAILGALNAPRFDHFVFNVSGGTWLSEQEIAALAAAVLPGLRIAPIAAAARCLDGEMGPLDTARARAAFGFSPSIPLAEGIAAYAATLHQREGDQAAAGKLFA